MGGTLVLCANANSNSPFEDYQNYHAQNPSCFDSFWNLFIGLAVVTIGATALYAYKNGKLNLDSLSKLMPEPSTANKQASQHQAPNPNQAPRQPSAQPQSDKTAGIVILVGILLATAGIGAYIFCRKGKSRRRDDDY